MPAHFLLYQQVNASASALFSLSDSKDRDFRFLASPVGLSGDPRAGFLPRSVFVFCFCRSDALSQLVYLPKAPLQEPNCA
jgi:hypothetical protein